nr:hypothetical protein [Tanacetum cinerariifolium]
MKKHWREQFPSKSIVEHWHQSPKSRKYHHNPSQMEFVQRKIKREKEGFALCARRITKESRSSNPTRGYEDEGIRRFKDYHGDGNMDGSTAAKEKGRVEHFGITLEKEEEGKYDASAHQNMVKIKCPNEDRRPTKGASTSGPIKEEDTHSSSGDDFIIIV